MGEKEKVNDEDGRERDGVTCFNHSKGMQMHLITKYMFPFR